MSEWVEEESTMASRQPKPPFWRRRNPPANYDIAILRSKTLAKGERFETAQDAGRESVRSERLLKSAQHGSNVLAETLGDCRKDRDCWCERPFCPICARTFRRWLIGQLLKITGGPKPVHIYTILLQQADSESIDVLDLALYRHSLRKRLQRAGLDVPAVGGFEMVYKANRKVWVLHINLVVVGGVKQAHRRFKRAFNGSNFDRPVVSARLNDPTKQLSYVLKFGTYHRPFEQQGPARSVARPLNGRQHAALVKWMSRFEFKDFLLLINARRRGHVISIHTGTD
jgi:hypothetical protein